MDSASMQSSCKLHSHFLVSHGLRCVESQILLNSLAPEYQAKHSVLKMCFGCIAHLIPYFCHCSIHKTQQENIIIQVKDRVSLLIRERITCYQSGESLAQGMLPFLRREFDPRHDRSKYRDSLALPMATNLPDSRYLLLVLKFL